LLPFIVADDCPAFTTDIEARIASSGVAALKAFSNALPSESKEAFICILQPMFLAGLKQGYYMNYLRMIMTQEAERIGVPDNILSKAWEATAPLSMIPLLLLQKHLCKAGLVVLPPPDVKTGNEKAQFDHDEEETGDGQSE